ncbi:MAG: hypothetical protein ACO3ND_04590 [Opitutales bacterium]
MKNDPKLRGRLRLWHWLLLAAVLLVLIFVLLDNILTIPSPT